MKSLQFQNKTAGRLFLADTDISMYPELSCLNPAFPVGLRDNSSSELAVDWFG